MEVFVLFVLIVVIVVIVMLVSRSAGKHAAAQADDTEEDAPSSGQLIATVSEAAATMVESLVKARLVLAQAHEEFESSRAPTFWERLDYAEALLDECVSQYERAGEAREHYEELRRNAAGGVVSSGKDDMPDGSEFEVLHEQTLELATELVQASERALVLDVFALVYEQRRQGRQLLEGVYALSMRLEVLELRQEAMREEMREDSERVLRAARAAERTASKARRAAKRAAGDWF